MFSLICDLYTDVSNKQQLSMCVRWIDDSLNPHEDFLGFYELPNIASDTIASAIKDSLTRFNLPLSDLRGQTYDGASNMLGKRSDVAAQIKRVQPKAIETHCHGHSLNLLVKDATKSSRLINDVLEIVAEITKLIKFSPKREQLLGAVKEIDNDDSLEQNDSLTKLCTTRWTVRANAFNKVINNFGPLFKLWNIFLGGKLDKETRSHILGCKSQMKEFRFFFGINSAYRMYSTTDNLSKALQRETTSSIEGQETAMKTVETFKSMRNIDSADCFFETAQQKAANHNFINESILPRKRKSPNYKSLNRFFIVKGQSSKAQRYFPSSLKEHYRAILFEVLDLIINSIQSRFDKPSFKMFLNLESLLIQAAAPTGNIDVPTLTSLHEMYGDEIDMDALVAEANVFRAIMSNCRVGYFKDVYNKIKTCPESEKELIPNITRIIKLFLINPATSCSPERSFSTARRLKSWLRSTMTNILMGWLC